MDKQELADSLQNAFVGFAAAYPDSALAIITGLFVGLLEFRVKEEGGDEKLEIKITGNGNRDITLSAVAHDCATRCDINRENSFQAWWENYFLQESTGGIEDLCKAAAESAWHARDAEVEELKAECFALAAGACCLPNDGLSADDGGVIFCKQECTVEALRARVAELEGAISETLSENAHLADGDVCTLIKLKRAAKAPGEFPKPSRRDGKEPCGECCLRLGETCDICGAKALGE